MCQCHPQQRQPQSHASTMAIKRISSKNFMAQGKPSLFKDSSCLSWEDMSIDANVIIIQQHNQDDKG